jgi:hypothetical protein
MLWAGLVLAQNFSFTIVSRARNSASLKRHTIASLLSNAIWFLQLFFATDNVTKVLTGKEGIGMAIIYLVIYVISATAGSILSHWWSLRSEHGKSRVGAY